MTQYLSDKIKVLSFISIIIVLYIHSDFHDVPGELQGLTFNLKLQTAISGMLGRCAVPLFFMISGYLFFLNTDKGLKTVFIKMKKRVRTLIVPYVIGCLYFPLLMVAIYAFPLTRQFINGGRFVGDFTYPWYIVMKGVFFISPQDTYPYAFQLWFLRDLILIVALCPLLYYIRKYFYWGGILCLVIATFTDWILLESLFWFFLGCSLINIDKFIRYPVFLIVSFNVLCLLEMMIPDCLCLKIFNLPIKLMGVMTIWKIYDCCVRKDFALKSHQLLDTCCLFTFFIYLFHEPTLNIVRKIIAVTLGKNSFAFAVSYLLSPWVFVSIWISVGIVLRKYLPKIYRLCVGGR